MNSERSEKRKRPGQKQINLVKNCFLYCEQQRSKGKAQKNSFFLWNVE